VHYFDRLAGNSWIRESLEQGVPVSQIMDRYEGDLEAFKSMSREYLIYD
jgi:uncharacterized protein YbbC (DUF1343 family)